MRPILANRPSGRLTARAGGPAPSRLDRSCLHPWERRHPCRPSSRLDRSCRQRCRRSQVGVLGLRHDWAAQASRPSMSCMYAPQAEPDRTPLRSARNTRRTPRGQALNTTRVKPRSLAGCDAPHRRQRIVIGVAREALRDAHGHVRCSFPRAVGGFYHNRQVQCRPPRNRTQRRTLPWPLASS